MTPGPQTYVVSVPSNPVLGVMMREPKFREKLETYAAMLGPGSYDVKQGIGQGPGWNFGKCLKPDERSAPEAVPGPGHYSRSSVDSQPAYSIPRSSSPLYTETDRLGPGYYRFPDPLRKGSGMGRFAASPRFRESSHEKLESDLYSDYRPRYKHLTPEEKSVQHQRFEANKDQSRYYPQAQHKRLTASRSLKSSQMAVAKAAKAQILQSVTARRKSLYEAKMQRFELRMQREELRAVRLSWTQVLTLSGSVTVLWVHLQARKQLKLRAQAVLKLLLLISLTIGRFLRMLLKIRKKRALYVLKALQPFASMWMIKKKQAFREVIAQSIERTLTQEVIYNLHRRWMRSLLLVQRAIRHFVSCRRVMYLTLREMWTQLEANLQKKQLKSRVDVEGMLLLVPERVRDSYLRQAIRRKCVAFFKALDKYRAECMRVTDKYREERLDLAAQAIMSGDPLPSPRLCLPQAPLFILYLPKRTIETLILDANAHRFQWVSKS